MLFMVPLDDPNNPLPKQVNTTGQAWEPQAGTDFVLWQSDGGFAMYDVNVGTSVTVGHVLDGARFLAVNGSTTVWTINSPSSTTNRPGLTATLLVFNWPR